MTIDNLPRLLQDAIKSNEYDINVITKHLKLPWLKLDLDFGLDENDHDQLMSQEDWRTKWNFPSLEDNSYQVKNWNGKIFFGPRDFSKFLDLSKSHQHDHDEDSKCRLYRKKMEYGWATESVIKQKIQKLIPDADLNLVNSYVLPPGGYIFPHRDYAIDGFGLAKIYVAVKWKKGNIFGMYGCGDIPIKQGDVLLVNNYTLPHWVYNGSDENRIVLDVSANLQSPNIKDSIINAFKKHFK